MSNFFYYGRDISYTFRVAAFDDVSEELDLSSVTDSPAIYVFTDKPDRAAAAAGTGAVQTISSWSDDGDGNKTFTISAINDPDTDDRDSRETYWLGINFVLADSEQTQTIVRALPLQRAIARHSDHGVNKTFLQQIFPELDDYRSDAEITNAITAAERKIKNKLEAANYEYALIWSIKDLNDAIALQALSYICESLVEQSGDRWDTRGDMYLEQSQSALQEVQLKITDTDNEEPETTQQPTFSSIRIIR